MSNTEDQARDHSAPLALPPPPDGEAGKVAVNTNQAFKFDSLGPVVVNKDGTLSRISNWENMTPIEKERTLRVLIVRNQVRLADQERQEATGDDQTKLSISQTQ